MHIIMIRGTGEIRNDPANMLEAVRRTLEPLGGYTFEDLDYPASIGPANPEDDLGGVNLGQSVSFGAGVLTERLWDLRGQRKAVIAYSLGGLVISSVLERWAGTLSWPEPDRPELPDFVGILANPARRRTPTLPGYGIHHETSGWPAGLTYMEIANPNDGITCCPDPSPLRTLSDQLDAFSFASLGGWTWDLASRLATGRWQDSAIDWRDPWGSIMRYAEAARLMRGYLDGSQHIAWYRDHGITPLVDAIRAVS